MLVALAILAIILMITCLRLNPFIVLMMVSIITALGAGMSAEQAVGAFEAGAGHVLGHVGIVIALGTMLGKMLTESGGADQIALTVSAWTGRRYADWAMMVIGLLVGLPVFFEIGFVLLIPIAFVLAARTNTPLLRIALPMCAALSVTHALIPPHPAALLAVDAYQANIGKCILLGLLVGVPVSIVAGPVFGRFAARHVQLTEDNPLAAQFVSKEPPAHMPGFGVTVLTILLPVLLMLGGSMADSMTLAGSGLNTFLHCVGNTDIALILATLLSFYTLGLARGFTRETVLQFSTECLGPTALIMLLVGAGGGFSHVLVQSGVSHAITNMALGVHMPLLLLAWLLAAVVRVACGSATVSMATSSGIVGPILLHAHNVSPELMVIATGAGSVAFGPMSDAGFWQIKEYLGLTVPQALKTWSVVETLIAVLGLVLCLCLSLVI